jgi:hypothetical protein
MVAPSGALTDTFGISAFEGAAGVPTLGFFARAPGGTYALLPRTTAPYLRVKKSIGKRVENYGRKVQYLSSSSIPLSSTTFRVLSSATCGLLVTAW